MIAIPRVDRAKWGSQVAEKRPANGEELAPGVIYADMQEVDAAAWDQLLPAATAAEVVIMDLRGYPTGDGLQILSRFMSSAARSPRFDIPIVGPTSPSQFGYETYRWFVEPTSPRLSAQLVVLVDARPQSYAETVLQLIKESSLAVLVGEPSAGTNGNVATFVVPGGFTVRFTAMRTLFEDGSTVHARGVQPDIVVHPTLQGIREGRDEILEAGLALAREMIASERSTSSN